LSGIRSNWKVLDSSVKPRFRLQFISFYFSCLCNAGTNITIAVKLYGIHPVLYFKTYICFKFWLKLPVMSAVQGNRALLSWFQLPIMPAVQGNTALPVPSWLQLPVMPAVQGNTALPSWLQLPVMPAVQGNTALPSWLQLPVMPAVQGNTALPSWLQSTTGTLLVAIAWYARCAGQHSTTGTLLVAIACYARCAGQHSTTLLVAITCYAHCVEMDVTEIILVKIYRFCQLSSHSCGFFARL
jgi:hypothetical protein